ncbi:MAG: LamG domain-containing protein [Victivallales bacterium]|nr:LamG domain-containing protein [Victivallales bacterium]
MKHLIIITLSFVLAVHADILLDFSQGVGETKLSGGVRLQDGVLLFDGTDGKVELPDSAGFNLTPSGLTATAVIRFQPHGEDFGQDIFIKNNEWRLCRQGKGTLWVAHTDGKKYHGGIKAGQMVPFGEWAHYAAVFERIQQQGQGRVGYLQKAYINGELVGQQEVLDVEPVPSDAPIIFGYGLGHKVWALKGEVASIKVWKRNLSDGEIEQDALSSGRVHLPNLQQADITPHFQQAADRVPSFAREALLQAAQNGVDQSSLLPAMEKLARGEQQNDIIVIDTGRMKALILAKGNHHIFPLIGIYDTSAQREVFGRHSMYWEIDLTQNGHEKRLRSSDYDATVKLLAPNQAEFVWNVNTLSIRMVLLFNGARMESSFSVENHDSSVTLTAASFPNWSFRKLSEGTDKLLIPFMSGIELAHPTTERSRNAHQDYYYPTSDLNMQFGAYYDDHSGIYFAHEDPTGAVKRIASVGRHGNLDIHYTTMIGHEATRGANNYVLQGKAVLELFTGNWYEAARIYRRFTEEKANWRITNLPRTDTPERLRNNTIIVHGRTRFGYTPEKLVTTLVKLRDYFELPFVVHWNEWEDIAKGDWPHFHIRADSQAAVHKLHKHDIDCEVYIDTRLWAEKDGPNREGNLMYESHGKQYALKTQRGSTPAERYERWFHEPGSGKGNKDGWYSIRYNYYVMCPAAKGYQEWIQALCKRLAGYGVNGIYHDQVMAALPYLCYAPEHGHLLGDSQTWIAQGYRPMFDTLRSTLKKTHPDLWHSSEDVSEPYMHMFDAGFCWRWTHEQVPLFSAVYAGKIQLGCRRYGDAAPGKDINAFYAKLAEQLVCGEQLGYFYTETDLKSATALLNIKRMAHLRSGLLSWFNGGELLKALPYREPIPIIGTLWDAYKGGSGGGDTIIHTPAIQQGHWRRLSDGAEVVILVNSTSNEYDANLQNTPEGSTLVTADGLQPYNGQAIHFAPFAQALILHGAPTAEMEKLTTLLKQITTFTPPQELP